MIHAPLYARSTPAPKGYVRVRLVPVPTLLNSSSSPSLGPVLLVPAALPEVLAVLVEPPASKLPRVRRERRGGGALTKSAKDPALPGVLLRCAEGEGMLCTGSGGGVPYRAPKSTSVSMASSALSASRSGSAEKESFAKGMPIPFVFVRERGRER